MDNGTMDRGMKDEKKEVESLEAASAHHYNQRLHVTAPPNCLIHFFHVFYTYVFLSNSLCCTCRMMGANSCLSGCCIRCCASVRWRCLLHKSCARMSLLTRACCACSGSSANACSPTLPISLIRIKSSARRPTLASSLQMLC